MNREGIVLQRKPFDFYRVLFDDGLESKDLLAENFFVRCLWLLSIFLSFVFLQRYFDEKNTKFGSVLRLSGSNYFELYSVLLAIENLVQFLRSFFLLKKKLVILISSFTG